MAEPTDVQKNNLKVFNTNEGVFNDLFRVKTFPPRPKPKVYIQETV